MILQRLKNYYHLLQSLIANIRYGFPARNFKIIGVTGTDGKTTCTSMIYHILKENGFKVAMISTLHAKAGEKIVDTGLHVTSPEPWELPKILCEFKKEGIGYLILESTSQGLVQNRLFGVKFDSCLITNIGRDHLDYHKTWENYANAKFKLIEKTIKSGLVVVNKDHESYKWIFVKHTKYQKYLPELTTFSKSEAKELSKSVTGMSFVFQDQKFKIPLIGEYNLENSLGVIKICEKYIEHESIASAISSFQAPKGRMQIMKSEPYTVIVDFAHTPSSLENALKAVNEIKLEGCKFVCVFGCAGERDKTRRKMGAVSAQQAEITLVTLEDPRTEKIKEINDEIIEYAKEQGAEIITRIASHEGYKNEKNDLINKLKSKRLEKSLFVVFDYDEVQNRIDAIELGLAILNDNDILFVTGKGHEESLAIGNPIVEYPYTDQETISSHLALST
ncbi:UDP-N-acetylmuramyl-tripeptide synthetase [Candidatus Dojkabacteria bacterium]|nr:UDP-N-acetylmuramyl-tripeptide synthetase [Candidatus Dojkabacteria bacterium]